MILKRPRRRLIITAAFGPPQQSLPEAFLRSAWQAKVDADILIIRRSKDREQEQFIEALCPTAFTVAPVNFGLYRILRKVLLGSGLASKWAGWLRAIWNGSPAQKRRVEVLAPIFLGIMASRFFFARAFLRSHKHEYGQVLLTDSRDVLFQRDPFEDFDDGLWMGIENCCLGDEPNNWNWLQVLYRDEPAVLERLRNERIICAGVTLGTREQVLCYLDLICAEIIRCFPRMAYQDYYDQAAHNKVAREPHGLNLRFTDNMQGWVAHLATSRLAEFQQDFEQGLRTLDGRLVSIVHQFDRHRKLCSILLARLASSQNDGRGARSAAETPVHPAGRT